MRPSLRSTKTPRSRTPGTDGNRATSTFFPSASEACTAAGPIVLAWLLPKTAVAAIPDPVPIATHAARTATTLRLLSSVVDIATPVEGGARPRLAVALLAGRREPGVGPRDEVRVAVRPVPAVRHVVDQRDRRVVAAGLLVERRLVPGRAVCAGRVLPRVPVVAVDERGGARERARSGSKSRYGNTSRDGRAAADSDHQVDLRSSSSLRRSTFAGHLAGCQLFVSDSGRRSRGEPELRRQGISVRMRIPVPGRTLDPQSSVER